MKRNLKYFAMTALCVFMASCDSNQGKVKNVAEEFLSAVAAKDRITINELYPSARTYSVLKLADAIDSKGIKVEFNKTDSVYIAKLNDTQSLVLKVAGKDTIKIIDSYNVLKLEKGAYDLAVETSAPIKYQSDMENGKLFDTEYDDGYTFINYLSEFYPAAIRGNLYEHDSRYMWGRKEGRWFVAFDIPVTNGGESTIQGADYSVEIEYYEISTNERTGTSVIDGVDLAPGETHVFTTEKDELYKRATNHDLTWNTNFQFKKLSKAGMLAKYGRFSGTEYEEYIKWRDEAMNDDDMDE